MILKPMGIPGVYPKHQRGWTKEESDFLVKNYGIISVADIAVATGRTTRAVEGKIALLRGKGIPPSRKNSPLTQKEKSFIRDNRYLMSASRMAKILGRHEMTIRKVARRMGVSLRKLGDYNPSTRYKDEDVRLIRALREDTPP
ncbi:AsnC family protein [Salmonella enterica]|nr:AsnC family protein [Salmonella enterica]EGS9052879.1 AsnC family protein [Salmonella enterica]